MRIAITTPTGNIGRELTKRLLDQRGHELILLARTPDKLTKEQARGAKVVIPDPFSDGVGGLQMPGPRQEGLRCITTLHLRELQVAEAEDNAVALHFLQQDLVSRNQREPKVFSQSHVGRVVDSDSVGPGNGVGLAEHLPSERLCFEIDRLEQIDSPGGVGLGRPGCVSHSVQDFQEAELGDDKLEASGPMPVPKAYCQVDVPFSVLHEPLRRDGGVEDVAPVIGGDHADRRHPLSRKRRIIVTGSQSPNFSANLSIS